MLMNNRASGRHRDPGSVTIHWSGRSISFVPPAVPGRAVPGPAAARTYGAVDHKRGWWRAILAGVAGAALMSVSRADAVNIGSRRELFVDDALVETLGGTARLKLH